MWVCGLSGGAPWVEQGGPGTDLQVASRAAEPFAWWPTAMRRPKTLPRGFDYECSLSSC